tara:strand:+ start:635 stop:892 length:258 start_codon:yes stop_codon:yes gene_type:complete
VNKNTEQYMVFLNNLNDFCEDIDNRCTMRDLEEQGEKAVSKLINDPDPAWLPDVSKRVTPYGSNTTNYSKHTSIPEDYKKKWYED